MNCLALQVDSHTKLATGLTPKQMRAPDFTSLSFSVSDTETFNELGEYIETSPLYQIPSLAFQVVINGVAARMFHKEIAAKNWLYEVNPNADALPLQIPSVASVSSQLHCADIIVLTQESQYVLAMLLQPLQINEHKQLAAFSLIKVGLDRLFDFTGNCLGNSETGEYV